jgi:hypothetical protein
MAKNVNNAEEAEIQPQTPSKPEKIETVSPAPPRENARFVIVKNLDAGTRDYPLADGSSIYLPMKHKGAVWPKIAESQIGPALRAAERKGHVQFVKN